MLGRTKGIPTFLFHLAFRLNEVEAIKVIKAAQKLGISESLYGRIAILEKAEKDLRGMAEKDLAREEGKK